MSTFYVQKSTHTHTHTPKHTHTHKIKTNRIAHAPTFRRQSPLAVFQHTYRDRARANGRLVFDIGVLFAKMCVHLNLHTIEL